MLGEHLARRVEDRRAVGRPSSLALAGRPHGAPSSPRPPPARRARRDRQREPARRAPAARRPCARARDRAGSRRSRPGSCGAWRRRSACASPPRRRAMSARISARGGQRVLARAGRSATQLALRLGQRHDRAERLQQPDEEDVRRCPGGRRGGTASISVVGRGDEVLVEERERDLVARAVDDDVGVTRRAVGEHDAVAVEARDVRLRRDRRRARCGRGCRPETVGCASPKRVVGLGQPVALHVARRAMQDQPRMIRCADRERDARVVGAAGRSAGRRRTWARSTRRGGRRGTSRAAT